MPLSNSKLQTQSQLNHLTTPREPRVWARNYADMQCWESLQSNACLCIGSDLASVDPLCAALACPCVLVRNGFGW